VCIDRLCTPGAAVAERTMMCLPDVLSSFLSCIPAMRPTCYVTCFLTTAERKRRRREKLRERGCV
jgi:hypothetical protein